MSNKNHKKREYKKDDSSDDISESEIKRQKVDPNEIKIKNSPTLTIEKLMGYDKSWTFGDFVDDHAYELLFGDDNKELKEFLVKQREFEKRKRDVLLSFRQLFPEEPSPDYYVWKEKIYNKQKTWIDIRDNKLKRKINDLAFSNFG